MKFVHGMDLIWIAMDLIWIAMGLIWIAADKKPRERLPG